MKIDDLTWPEVKKLFKSKAVIIPIGSTEQHGPHLPLGTDTFYTEHISNEVGKNLNIAVLPAVNYSVSGFNFPYPTITLEPETIKLLLNDICRSLKFFGIEKIFFIIGHGGENCSAVETSAYCIARDLGIMINIIYPWTFLSEDMKEKMKTDWHAGFIETSEMLFLKKELVKKDKIKRSSVPETMKFIKDYKKIKSDKRDGVFGNPIGANASIGKKNMKKIIKKIIVHISKLLK